MTRRFLEDLESGGGGDVVEPGTYTAEVVDARPLEGKPFIWVDLKIVGGPDDGRVVSVGVNVPNDQDERGARYWFGQKVGAFLAGITAARVFEMPDDDQIDALADVMMGVKLEATLDIQKGGAYDGSQQLLSTKPFVDTAGAPGPTRSGRKEHPPKLQAVAGDPVPVAEDEPEEDEGPPF